MTYARIHLLLLMPVLVGVAWAARNTLRLRHVVFLVAFSFVVVGWTTPWDQSAVARGLWSFDPERVSGFWIGRLPVEELAFFLLQTWITAIWIQRRVVRS